MPPQTSERFLMGITFRNSKFITVYHEYADRGMLYVCTENEISLVIFQIMKKICIANNLGSIDSNAADLFTPRSFTILLLAAPCIHMKFSQLRPNREIPMLLVVYAKAKTKINTYTSRFNK